MAGRIADLDIENQRAALAEACRFRLVRKSPGSPHFEYQGPEGEFLCEQRDWQPDWNIDQALLAAREMFVIGQLSFQDAPSGDGAEGPAEFQLGGVTRIPPGIYIRGKTCDSASETVFDADIQALERRRACPTATA